MPAVLDCSYSTISTQHVLSRVLPQYLIDEPIECVLWERGANDTYLVRCANAQYFLRIYRCGAFTREANEFEAQVLIFLHQNGISVASPVARREGGYISDIAAPEGLRFALLTHEAEGDVPDYDSLDNCRLVGESVARMHLLSEGFETPLVRMRLDLQGLLDTPLIHVRDYLHQHEKELKYIEAAAQQARSAIQAAPEAELKSGICHGDLHGGNLHLSNGTVTHFDFEECAFGYSIYDMATFRWGACFGKAREARWPAFLEGYESVRTLTDTEHSLINMFVITRELSELAYGIRHVQFFGSNDIMASDLDHVCERIKVYTDNA